MCIHEQDKTEITINYFLLLSWHIKLTLEDKHYYKHKYTIIYQLPNNHAVYNQIGIIILLYILLALVHLCSHIIIIL